MSSIASGQDDERIVMLCGRSAGWHAAVAEWLFGLRTKLTVKDGASFEGKTVYDNCPEEKAQLIVTFNNPGIPMDGDVVDDPDMPVKQPRVDQNRH